MPKKDSQKNKKILNEICEDSSCHHNGEYCILKEMLMSMGVTERTLVQLKCVEKFKYEESERQKQDIGWQKAFSLWVELKYAEKFADVYDANPDQNYRDIYRKVIT